MLRGRSPIDTSSALGGSHEQAFDRNRKPRMKSTWVSCLRKQPTFCEATSGFTAKWSLRNERRNSILMTFTTKIWIVFLIGWSKFPTRHDQSEALAAIHYDTRETVKWFWSVFMLIAFLLHLFQVSYQRDFLQHWEKLCKRWYNSNTSVM